MPLSVTNRQSCVGDGKGFTLVELLTVIAVVAILAVILIPVVGDIRMRSLMTKSTSNLRQYYLGADLFRIENGGRLVPGEINDRSGNLPNGHWFSGILCSYMGYEKRQELEKAMVCPAYENPGGGRWAPVGYGINDQPGLDSQDSIRSSNRIWVQRSGKPDGWTTDFRAEQITHSDKRMLFCVSDEWQVGGGRATSFPDFDRFGGDKAPVVFFDGHTDSLNADQMYYAINDPQNLNAH